MENTSTEELVSLLKIKFPNLVTSFHEDLINQDVFLYSINDHYKEHYITAAGMDRDSDTAKRKAISEFIERVAFFEQDPITFKGFAAHPNLLAAKENSIKELIERDHLLTSWLIKRPPTYLEEEQVLELVTKEYKDIYLNTKSSKLFQRFGVIGTQGKYITACAYIKNSQEGHILATATETSVQECFEKLILDMRRSANIALSYKEDENSEFNHINYYLSSNCKEDSSWFLEPQGPSSEVLVFPEYTIETKEYKANLLGAVPIFTAISYSPESQLYFHGKTIENKINTQKFLTNYDLSYEELNHQTHPLG
jgi:hypothetical protein